MSLEDASSDLLTLRHYVLKIFRVILVSGEEKKNNTSSSGILLSIRFPRVMFAGGREKRIHSGQFSGCACSGRLLLTVVVRLDYENSVNPLPGN